MCYALKVKILFLGEGALDGPARYLAAVLTWARLPFKHLPDRTPLPRAWQAERYDAVILSDYRYSSWTPSARVWLARTVSHGTGLMMIGGWASFTGRVGGYAGTDIEDLLPVHCIPGDDRVNSPAVLINQSTPSVVVCGYHQSRPKRDARTAMEFRELEFQKGKPVLGTEHPALVVGHAGKGRTAAFLTDCAPHWAGNLVDWGKKRVRIQLSRNNTVEVGGDYLKFFRRWILWTTQS
jgi:uncharacterized membrane protein